MSLSSSSSSLSLSLSSLSSLSLSSSSSSSSTSNSDSSDSEFEVLPRPRIIRNRGNPFLEYDETDFKRRYRFNKMTVREIIEIIGPNIEPQSGRNNPVDALNQLLITLRFYATGAFQCLIGDQIKIDKSTVCRIIPKVTDSIATLGVQFIKMPATEEERHKIHNKFFSIHGFPCVLGAIDATHVRIQSPGGENGEVYRNRKGYFSVNVQAVCDGNLKIMDLVARWPGSVHDSTIFNASFLKARLENNEFPNCYLLGDNGYACKNYLLTPLLNPQSASEMRYNRAHIATRNTIERTFGVLKRRFPCLSVGMRIKVEKVFDVIVATSVLHNIALNLSDNVDFEENLVAEDILPMFNVAVNENRFDNIVRRNLINTTFSQ